MILPPTFLSLPSSLLAFLLTSSLPAQAADVTQAAAAQWPYNLPAHVKYWPEDPPHRRRDLEAATEHILSGHSPIAVKKMSEDESEMFFPDYWGFEAGKIEARMLGNWFEASDSSSEDSPYQEEEGNLLINVTAQTPYQAPFAVHAMNGNLDIRDLEARARAAGIALEKLQKRDFVCPSGTFSCTSINQPNYCCATGSSCFNITDTGLGPVGCCSSGMSCSGDITSCAPGNTACPQSLGGACCIPGFVCAGVGCVSNVVVTIFSTVTQIVSDLSSTVIIPVTTSTSSLISTSTSTLTDTAIQTTLACASSYTACPINMGGGCCLSGRICTTGLVCPLPGTLTLGTGSSSATASAPVRGTSASDTSPSPSTTILTGSQCPTGFYACSAYLPAGGCCRIGRDCATTNCPSTASTTLVSSGQTIVVPLVPSATTTASGSCPSGWDACPASLGGACCPNGWTCGTESCSTTGASATATVAKDGPVPNAGLKIQNDLGAFVLVVACIGFMIAL